MIRAFTVIVVVLLLSMLYGCQPSNNPSQPFGVPVTESNNQNGFGSFSPESTVTNQSEGLQCKNHVSKTGDVLGGYGTGPGIKIEWQGSAMPNAAAPLDVLKLTAQRMSHLQSTPEANDNQARALMEILEAIDALEGTQDVSAPVGPGFVSPQGNQ